MINRAPAGDVLEWGFEIDAQTPNQIDAAGEFLRRQPPLGPVDLRRAAECRRRKLDGKTAVPARGAPESCLRGLRRCDPDRETWRLQACRCKARVAQLVIISVVTDRVSAQEWIEYRQSFIQPAGAAEGRSFFAKRREINRGGFTEADPTDDAPVRKVVQRGQFLGELPRSSTGQGCHHGAEADLPGGLRQRAQHHGGVDQGRSAAGHEYQMVPNEETVEAGRFGSLGQCNQTLWISVIMISRNIQGSAHGFTTPGSRTQGRR